MIKKGFVQQAQRESWKTWQMNDIDDIGHTKEGKEPNTD